jgi:hypothetical protein
MSRLILLALAFGLALWCVQTLLHLRTAVPARKTARAGYFAAAASLLKDLRHQIQATGFARVAGRYRGLAIDLQALPDTLTFRKLPALWVMATVTEPQPLSGETHIMARATGLESFSTYPQMPIEVALPPGFPPDCTLRCTAVEDLPGPAVLAQLAPLFTDPRMKEAVLSAKGLRLVVLAEEADRTGYLIFRDAELGRTPFPAARLAALLDTLADLHVAQSPLKASA